MDSVRKDKKKKKKKGGNYMYFMSLIHAVCVFACVCACMYVMKYAFT